MKAVILAAGVGSRIRPLTDQAPKSLLEINGSTILGRMLTNIQKSGIKDVTIVTGYLEEKIKEFASSFTGLNIKYVRNDKFDKTNTAYSLMLTKKFIRDEDFVKFDADVVFEQKILEKLIQSPFKSALCIDKNIHLDKEEVKVQLGTDGRVLKVGKKIDFNRASGESIGIEKIGKEAGKILFGELEQLLKDPNKWNEYYDDSYTTLVELGIPFGAVDISGLKWVEIDTHEDYAKAQKLFTK
ncbi:MAG TPA: phosphocholine cytidylyltransferase family protein [Patescibacteria group bacterium]|nr:phosphocholine cytidylyltransferase family protein [Patescibacteria group bacterium]